jgi:hypothetical protein
MLQAGQVAAVLGIGDSMVMDLLVLLIPGAVAVEPAGLHLRGTMVGQE